MTNKLLKATGCQAFLAGQALSISSRIALVFAASIGFASAQTPFTSTPDPDQVAQAQWRETITKMEIPNEGCFHAKFPSAELETVPCSSVSPQVHPLHRRANPGEPQTTGNGNDYALVAKGLITQTVGSFPAMSGVTSEVSVGVADFGYGGILGSNEYTLQVNTNFNLRTAACSGGASWCTAWQQFVYATDYPYRGSGAAIFMEYWLINYGADGAQCPSGFNTAGADCWRNGLVFSGLPDVPPANLRSYSLTANATPGGSDKVTFAGPTEYWWVSGPDSSLYIGTVWEESEFNVVGDAGGSEAAFSPGASITVNVAALYGSTSAPGCASNAGTTGETNNLNLGPCAAAGGANPYIQFTESSPFDGLVPGETIAEGQFIKSPSGQFGFILQDDGNLVLYELPNGLALWASGTNGKSVATCIMQTDGNLVLYSPNGTAVWDSKTNGNPGASLVAQNDGNVVIYRSNGTAAWDTHTVVPTGPTATGSTMTAGEVLDPGQSIRSTSGRFEFVQQTDGNLVLYDLAKGIAIWAAGTQGQPVAVCIMQTDGNLVQYAAGPRPVSDSGTNGNPGAYLVVQNDGNVVIYRTNGTAAWSTHTSGQ